jgi:hypothetical protein
MMEGSGSVTLTNRSGSVTLLTDQDGPNTYVPYGSRSGTLVLGTGTDGTKYFSISKTIVLYLAQMTEKK